MSEKKKMLEGNYIECNDFIKMVKDIGYKHSNKIVEERRRGKGNQIANLVCDGMENMLNSVLNSLFEVLEKTTVEAATIESKVYDVTKKPVKGNLILPGGGLVESNADVLRKARDS